MQKGWMDIDDMETVETWNSYFWLKNSFHFTPLQNIYVQCPLFSQVLMTMFVYETDKY